jgi:hypothetical protein
MPAVWALDVAALGDGAVHALRVAVARTAGDLLFHLSPPDKCGVVQTDKPPCFKVGLRDFRPEEIGAEKGTALSRF